MVLNMDITLPGRTLPTRYVAAWVVTYVDGRTQLVKKFVETVALSRSGLVVSIDPLYMAASF